MIDEKESDGMRWIILVLKKWIVDSLAKVKLATEVYVLNKEKIVELPTIWFVVPQSYPFWQREKKTCD